MVEFVIVQVMLIPILGGFWLGIRRERQEAQQLLYLAIKAARRGR